MPWPRPALLLARSVRRPCYGVLPALGAGVAADDGVVLGLEVALDPADGV